MTLPARVDLLPRTTRRALREGRVRARMRTSQQFALPGFLILGAQRAGTTSLYQHLCVHPGVVGPLRKEVGYFSTAWGRGERWYRCHFPPAGHLRSGAEPVSFDATPYYLLHPLAPGRAAQLVPDAELIVLLREPGARAFSHYLHNRRLGVEELAFEDAIGAEPGRIGDAEPSMRRDPSFDDRAYRRYSYLARGRYAEQIARWLRWFPAERLHVIRSEDLYTDPIAVHREVSAFLGLRPWDRRTFPRGNRLRNTSDGHRMRPDTRSALDEHFRPHNERLYDLIQRDLGW